ncbi:MAG: translocation/assembly module TamB domain-containing protein [Gammaproteobacteria bacterium]
MRKSARLIGLLLVLMIPAGLFGLINSASGTRWLLQAVFSSLSAQTSAKAIEGRLLERITISGLRYQIDAETVAIDRLVFAWRPSELFSGTLKIVEIFLDGVSISLTEAQPPAEASAFDFDADLRLPLAIAVDTLLLTDVSIQKGEMRRHLDKLRLSAFTEQGRLRLVSLTVNAEQLIATAKGDVVLGQGFPFRLTAEWGGRTEAYGSWQVTSEITGTSDRLSFDNRVSSPFQLDLKGRLEHLQDTPRLSLRGDWQKLNWPPGAPEPEATSAQGYIELAGELDDYQVMLGGELSRPSLPKADVTFKGKGRRDALSIQNLELKSKAGTLRVDGDVSWNEATVFDLKAAARQFNPAIFWPELPGSLTFDTHIHGRQAAKALELNVDIMKLTGELRGSSVNANGKLAWTGEQLKVDRLRLAAGANHLAVNGLLGPQRSALDVAIDAPALEALGPTLGGSLKAEGHVRGAWKNPAITLQARGKQLHFAEHRAERLTLDIDLRREAETASKILLHASDIEAGAARIATLRIDGKGTLEQHRLSLDLSSSHGELAGVLTGRQTPEAWQGEISQLEFMTPEAGRWRLAQNPAVRVAPSPLGVEATWTEACWVQQAASLCTQGRYQAEGDSRLILKATALPTQLIQHYLPKQAKLKGFINAEADIRRQQGSLSGRYRLSMPAHAKMVLTHRRGATEFALGPSSLSGTLKGSAISADIDLALIGQDYLRGRLRLDTGKSQALSGQLSASVVNFAWLPPVVPALSEVQGRLKADLTLQGTPTEPVLDGSIEFQQGLVEMADFGVRLHEINLQAIAAGGRGNRIRLQGSLVPAALTQADAAEHWQFKDRIRIEADVRRQHDGLVGQYRLDVPAGAAVAFKTPGTSAEIALGASSLSGGINGNIVSADLDLMLNARDYLRAQLQLDTGASRAISGKITASVVEFAALNPFVPQLSNLKGRLKADLALKGSTDKPAVDGVLRFSEGAVDLTDLGIGLRGITLQANAAPADTAGRMLLSGSAKSGQGAVKLDGFAAWPGTAELILTGSDFEVAKLPEAEIAVSPDLKLAFARPKAKVTGKLKIPKAVLTLRQLPVNAVQVSRDEVILGEEKAEQDTAVAADVDADIDIELGKQIRFSGQGLETGLSGKLKITRTGGQMAMYGNVDMHKARYNSYGQDLTVRKGRFLFNGPVDKPWLDVEAIRVSNSKKVTAILNLTGPLETPQTRLSSEPALPETEILAYLVTGKPLSEVSRSEGDMVAGAALSYGAARVSWLAEKLGIKEFEIEKGKTLQDTLVAVGQYLTPDFYVGTKVGLFNKQAVLVLKHKLTDTVNIETQSGTSQRIKLNYEFDTD